MIDPKQIPYLVKLLDDDSSEVKNTVLTQLASFGPTLKSELTKIPFRLSDNQQDYLDVIFKGQDRILLKQQWPSWFKVYPDYERLEKALTSVSEYLDGYRSRLKLKALLDQLANAYRKKYSIVDAKHLAYFLFREKNLRGNESDYYNPQNSNLIYVIKKRKGIPISLSCIYMLVGYRLGLKIEGCHFPGHFLSKIKSKGKGLFVDCFSGGQIIRKGDILKVRQNTLRGLQNILNETADPESIVRRFLANLIRAYQMQDNIEDSKLMIDLFKELDDRVAEQKFSALTPDDIIAEIEPFYIPGQLIRHKRYGYRGIVVDFDLQCTATDSWYYGNQTQPNRNQPWYHIFVHGSDQVTYVAETNLVEEASDDYIEHPLLSYFFNKSEAGEYIRNDNPWPETDL